MNDKVRECVEDLLGDASVEAIYLYGSYVNGYYREDSDIDIVALTNINSAKKPIDLPPNISCHLISPLTTDFYETGHPYTHLRMVPLHNSQKCLEISDRLKSELVRRQLIRFRSAGKNEFDLLEPLVNYLYQYALQRPWRIKPIKRMLNSAESIRILGEEYRRILQIMETRGVVREHGERYRINEYFVFDDKIGKVRDRPMFKLVNSDFGWSYLRNAPDLINFSRRII